MNLQRHRRSMVLGLALIGLCICLSGCQPSRPSDDDPQHGSVPELTTEQITAGDERQILTDLRVATYNINFGNRDLPAVVNAIRQADADVVCLQETNGESARHLRQAFSQDYPVIRFYGSVDRYAAAGFGLLSRIPLRSEEFQPAEHGLFGTCYVELENGGEAIELVIVHLQPFIFDRRRNDLTFAGISDAMLQSEQTRKLEIESIRQRLRPDIPSLVVGDFNSLTTFQAPTLLAAAGYVDSFASIEREPESHRTWHWPTRLGEVSLRIDYLFHSPSLRTATSRVIPTSGSDHYLLVSQLELVPSSNRDGIRP